MLMTQPLLDL